MNGLWLILMAAAFMLTSGLPAICGSRQSRRGQLIAAALMVLASLLGLTGLITVLTRAATPARLLLPWHPTWGEFAVGLDPLSAVFLIPVFVVPALGAVYGLDYWRQSEHPGNGRRLNLFYGLLAGAMVMVVIARDSILLLMSWEIMALAAFFLASAENDKAEVRQAAWIYLVATHAGTVCLLALFALLRQVSGSTALTMVDAASVTPGIAAALFLLSLIGFGFKAGIMPLHVWLPGAHANAPSHVSAVLSGVMLKMGIYGIVRMLTLLPVTELWNGQLLLGLGAVTGVLGIAFALAQRDIKRLLAYSSIENIGIIAMGIGLALLGRVLQREEFILLGLGGALLHVWNHSLFKSLLFLNAGTIMHAVHSRDMNRMGGLARYMPRTAALFMIGAVAICGLPPLNGFVSEWLIYLGFFHSIDVPAGSAWPLAGISAAALALIGAMSLACFVKVYSLVFLGVPRLAVPTAPQDPPALMHFPMLLLAAGCVALGLLPQFGLRLIWAAAGQWLDEPLAADGQAMAAALVPIHWLSGLALVLVLAAGGGVVVVRWKMRRRTATPAVGTWGCGYAAPTCRMQYTSASFSEMLIRLFTWVLRPHTRQPVITAPFPAPTEFAVEVPDTLLARVILPVFRYGGRQMMKLRMLQQGHLSIYLLYILIVTLLLLCWAWAGTGR